MGCFDYEVLYSAGYIAAALFGGVFVPLLIAELRRAQHGRAKKKFKLKLKNSFKSPQFVKMIGITKLIQLGLVGGIAFICLYTILDDAINGSPSNGSWLPAFSWLVYIWEVFLGLEFLFIILERSRRGTNIITDLERDYKKFYDDNKISTNGRCRICGRPIPEYYGLSKVNSGPLEEANICFQMDGQHLVALQQAGNTTLLSEYKKINRNIKHGLEFRFWVEAFIPLAAIVVLTIAQEYIAPYYFEKGFDFGDPSCLDKFDDFLLFVQTWIVGIGALEFFLFDLFAWPDIVHYLVTKRLYYDNSVPVIVESLEEGRELPVGYGKPPDYTRKGDELPGFIETLKMAKKLTDNLKNLPKSVADVQSLKDAAGVAKDVKDIHDDVKEFKDEKVSGKGRISGIDEGREEILDENIEKIKKLKELLDSGIITQEEFEQKKRELLSRV